MFDREYEVLVDNCVVASMMDMKTAVILLEGLFNEFYDDSITVSIRKIEQNEVTAND